MTLSEIVDQLRACGYECEAGKLENNVAFVELEKLAAAEEEVRLFFEYLSRTWVPDED